MYLQGDLQAMFDALYHMGVIDPVLEMNWNDAIEEISAHVDDFAAVIGVANQFQNDLDKLMQELQRFDQKTLGYLAMEVAKEFADFHSREAIH